MRFAWIGFHREGLDALDALLEAGAPIQAVLTLRPDLAVKRSGGTDYFPICSRRGVPLHYIDNVNGPEAHKVLSRVAPEVVFVIGWHQIVRPDALALARTGMIGAHASLLPHNRGSAPINWSIMKGERETGNSLIWLAPDVDAGDLIDQAAFPITPYDTCATLYQHVARTNREMLLRVLPQLLAGERPGTPQVRTDEPVLRRRRPVDGCIDWSAPATDVYNFIRALTRPYPGAFSSLDGRAWRVWRAALVPGVTEGSRPGEVLGAVLSPTEDACGQLVACGSGAVVLLEVEADDGSILQGPALADQAWSPGRSSSSSRRARPRDPARAGDRGPSRRRAARLRRDCRAAHPRRRLRHVGDRLRGRVVALRPWRRGPVRPRPPRRGDARRRGHPPARLRRPAPRHHADDRHHHAARSDCPRDRARPRLLPVRRRHQPGPPDPLQGALVATRPTWPSIQGVYTFDTASSTEWAWPRTFNADTWVDISTTLDAKLAAMACYESELREYPHPRSLGALRNRAKAWGNQQCLDAAEVFMTVRRTLRDGQAPI